MIQIFLISVFIWFRCDLIKFSNTSSSFNSFSNSILFLFCWYLDNIFLFADQRVLCFLSKTPRSNKTNIKELCKQGTISLSYCCGVSDGVCCVFFNWPGALVDYHFAFIDVQLEWSRTAIQTFLYRTIPLLQALQITCEMFSKTACHQNRL